MEIKELNVYYDKKLVIDSLNLTISDHCFTAIIGRNGSGKSTLLKALVHLHHKQSGEVLIGGNNISSMKEKEIARQITLLNQSPTVSIDMTVYHLVSMGRYPHLTNRYLTKKDHEVIKRSLKEVHMWQFRDELISSLSGGQQRRVWIALALAQETPYLLLDEPTTYLDLEGQLEILMLLSSLQKRMNKTIVMVHHDINQVARFCDEVIVMDEGKIKAHGKISEVMTSELLSQVYNVQIEMIEDFRYRCPQMTHYELWEEKNEKT